MNYGRNYWLAFAAQACFCLCCSVFIQYAVWLKLLGANVAEAGRLLGIASFLSLAIRPWVADSINRFGARRVWMAGMLLAGASCAANLLLDSAGTLAHLVQTASTVAMALGFSAGIAFAADAVPEDRRTSALATFGVAGFVGTIFGPTILDLIVGKVPSRDGFAQVFKVVAAGNLIGAAVLAFATETPPHPRPPFRLATLAAAARTHWPGLILLVNLAFGLVMAIPFRIVGRFIEDTGLHDLGIRGFFWAYGGMGITVRLLMPTLPERLGLRRTVLLSLGLFALGFPMFALATPTHPWLALPGAAICGFAHGIIFPAMMALSLRTFPPSERGTGSVLALLAQELGGVVGMPLMGWLADQSFHYAFAAASGLAGLVALVYYLGERPAPADAAVHAEDAAAAEAESAAGHTTEVPAA